MNEQSDLQKKKENHIEVVVVTTSGSYPQEGYEEVPIHQKIKVILEKAAQNLGIVSTDKWVAKVNGNVVSPDSTYLENGFSGQITIDFGPSEGGGGE